MFINPDKPLELLIGITGVVAGFVHFLYAQHHQETQLFVSLFDKFNERYAALNDGLNNIVSRNEQATLSRDDINVIFDYFNRRFAIPGG